jgi:isochorismate synthase
MPHENGVWFIQSESSPLEIDSLKSMPEKAGFIMVPFSSEGFVKSYFIQADKHTFIPFDEIDKVVLEDDKAWKIIPGQMHQHFKSKDEFCEDVVSAKKAIESGIFRKVVLSRIKQLECNTRNPLKIFHKLCIKHPAAFVSLIHIPDNITWITATPELLVSSDENKITTVSLAGTKSINSIEDWGEKEKMEQHIVTEYINEILEKYCENITVSLAQEVIAGNVKHLKSSFSASLSGNFWNLVSALHPTPAVCGIPLKKTKQFIKETEGYDRTYYTGFLGPCHVKGKTDLFVNLRCGELFSNGVNLYIGGGITKDSIPENEWEETELKLRTLLFAFEENEKG